MTSYSEDPDEIFHWVGIIMYVAVRARVWWRSRRDVRVLVGAIPCKARTQGSDEES